MKWIWLTLFVMVVGTAGVALAQEYGSAYGSGNRDPWSDTITPSGLRFTEPAVQTQTGGYGAYGGGGYGANGGMGGCNTCTWGGGACAHWTTLPWYAPWPTAHAARGYGAGACRVAIPY